MLSTVSFFLRTSCNSLCFCSFSFCTCSKRSHFSSTQLFFVGSPKLLRACHQCPSRAPSPGPPSHGDSAPSESTARPPAPGSLRLRCVFITPVPIAKLFSGCPGASTVSCTSGGLLFITAGPMAKLFACAEEKGGGQVL